MGLEELLTKLDKKIWQRCERITQLASKEFGWDKYNLKNITDACSGVFLTGMGGYSFIQNAYQINTNQASFSTYLLARMGTVLIPGGILFYNRCRKENESLKESELKLSEDKEIIYPPKFSPYRPITLSCGGLIFSLSAVYRCIHGDDTYHTATALFLSMTGGVTVSAIMSTYFQDQHLTPRTKKKDILRKFYESLLQSFQKIKEVRPENICSGV